jgi:hypothetical protein
LKQTPELATALAPQTKWKGKEFGKPYTHSPINANPVQLVSPASQPWKPFSREVSSTARWMQSMQNTTIDTGDAYHAPRAQALARRSATGSLVSHSNAASDGAGVGRERLEVNVPSSVLTSLPTLAIIRERPDLAATMPVRADKAIERH